MGLFSRCRHRWEEVGEHFTAPPERSVDGRFSPAEKERILYGFTTIKLRCSECSDIAVREFVGDVRGES